jgi:CDP-glycerol glycerophosphotransferase
VTAGLQPLGTPSPSVVILAAGLGTRLGRPFPKPLTEMEDGRSIMQRQWETLRTALPGCQIHIVVGFKKELVMEAFPDALFIYNSDYSETNTSKSLLRALRAAHSGGVVWLNGDVVFDEQVLTLLYPCFEAERTAVCVNTARVAEEVKYTLTDDGYVRELSKSVQGALGEAVGINFVAARDRAALIRHLDACDDSDYFERGIETAIVAGELKVTAVDITGYGAVEVDTAEDLAAATAAFRS